MSGDDPRLAVNAEFSRRYDTTYRPDEDWDENPRSALTEEFPYMPEDTPEQRLVRQAVVEVGSNVSAIERHLRTQDLGLLPKKNLKDNGRPGIAADQEGVGAAEDQAVFRRKSTGSIVSRGVGQAAR